jgi:hypothetical protein
MVFLFRDRSDINVLFLVLLSVAVHFHFYLEPPIVIANPTDGLLAYLLFHYVKPMPPLALIVIFHLIVVVQALRLNILVSRFKMFQHVSYLPAFTFVVLTAMFPFWDAISSGLIANAFIIWILVKLNRLYDQTQPKTLEFNIGMIVGCSILLYEPIAILIPVVIFALAIIRPFRLTEWLVLIMGIVLPFYFIFTYVFLTDSAAAFTAFLPKLDWENPLAALDAKSIIALSFMGLQLLIGLYFWQDQQNRFIIQVRKYWGVMLLTLVVTFFQPIIFSSQALYASAIVIAPLASFISFCYAGPKQLMTPNVSKIEELDCRGLIVTAEGPHPFTCTSRMFAPRFGILEDPVTGSAHCVLAGYWQDRLGVDRIRGFQASQRTGVVDAQQIEGRVILSGDACLVMKGTLYL